jgi:hypothetical protein
LSNPTATPKNKTKKQGVQLEQTNKKGKGNTQPAHSKEPYRLHRNSTMSLPNNLNLKTHELPSFGFDTIADQAGTDDDGKVAADDYEEGVEEEEGEEDEEEVEQDHIEQEIARQTLEAFATPTVREEALELMQDPGNKLQHLADEMGISVSELLANAGVDAFTSEVRLQLTEEDAYDDLEDEGDNGAEEDEEEDVQEQLVPLHYSPEQVHAPVYTPSPAQFPEPAQAPLYVPSHAPLYVPSHAPLYVPSRAPLYAPLQAPLQAPTLAPSRAPLHAPLHAPLPFPERPRQTATFRSPGYVPWGQRVQHFTRSQVNPISYVHNLLPEEKTRGLQKLADMQRARVPHQTEVSNRSPSEPEQMRQEMEKMRQHIERLETPPAIVAGSAAAAAAAAAAATMQKTVPPTRNAREVLQDTQRRQLTAQEENTNPRIMRQKKDSLKRIQEILGGPRALRDRGLDTTLLLQELLLEERDLVQRQVEDSAITGYYQAAQFALPKLEVLNKKLGNWFELNGFTAYMLTQFPRLIRPVRRWHRQAFGRSELSPKKEIAIILIFSLLAYSSSMKQTGKPPADPIVFPSSSEAGTGAEDVGSGEYQEFLQWRRTKGSINQGEDDNDIVPPSPPASAARYGSAAQYAAPQSAEPNLASLLGGITGGGGGDGGINLGSLLGMAAKMMA